MIIDNLPTIPSTVTTGDELPVERGTTTYKIDYNALAEAILARLGAGSDNIVDVANGGTGANNALSARSNLESAHAGYLGNTVNVDNIRDSGLYYCVGCSATGIDDNVRLWGQLLVISSGPWNNVGTPGQNDRLCQVFFFSFQNHGQKWIQYRIYDGAWSGWRVLLDNYGAVPVASGGTGANTRLGAQHELMAYGAGANTNDNPATYGPGVYHLGSSAFDTSYWPATSLWGVMMIWSTQYYTVALILHAGTTIYRGFKDSNATTFAWKSAQLS